MIFRVGPVKKNTLYHRDLLHKADLRPPPHQDSHLSREVKALFCLKPRVQNNKTWIRKYLFQKAPESISGRESPSYWWVVRYVLNLSQFINEYVCIFNIQIWPNQPGHPTDLPFRSKTLQPKCVKLIMRTGAMAKPCTSKPGRNIKKVIGCDIGGRCVTRKNQKLKTNIFSLNSHHFYQRIYS